jgi:2-keto-4-pentenoate hydratase/2-oxohepta-3-ene-1,7-dioic acid hydratase in catechol pathway
MKICMYRRPTPMGVIERMGIITNDFLMIDPNLVMQAHYEKENFYDPKLRALRHCPPTLSEWLKQADHPIESLKGMVDMYQRLAKMGDLKTKTGGDIAFDMRDAKDVSMGVPLDCISSYRDFFTHEKHVKTGFEKRKEPIPPAWYEIPAYYKGATTGFIATNDMIPWPSYTQELDYELELGVVIARDGKNIKAADAHKYIFGYTILNDISARDIQRKEMSIRLGPAKGKDFCSIMGPVIVTADEFNGKDPDL